ncbi:MAG: miniconductance mechanosensitive channel [Desulforhopalus sp.]
MSELIKLYPYEIYIGVVVFAMVVSPLLQTLFNRVVFRIAMRTESVIDDLLIDALRPFRFIYALPVGLAFFLAHMVGPYAYQARLVSGLILVYFVVETAIKLLNGIAGIIRHKSGAKGVSSTGYIDILKIVVILAGIAFAASISIETDILTLLSGLGAAAAILGFIFKDTLHAIFASIKIASWNLIREGDWIAVPNFNADGIVVHIGLYDIKVRNWDLTTSLIPTHKVLEVANTNFSSMQVEARARRIQEKFLIDIETIRICDRPLLEKLSQIELISDLVAEKLEILGDLVDPTVNAGCVASVSTNYELFKTYVERYLQTRDDVHQKQNFILIRTLAPTHHGLPLDIFAFTRETDLVGFSNIQTSIFDHFIAMIVLFDLRLYQIHMEK